MHRAVHVPYSPTFPSHRFLAERMRQYEWCPRQMKQLCRTYVFYVMYYLSSIRRQEPWDIKHGACSNSRCYAYNTDEKLYQMRHLEAGSCCDVSHVSVEEVAVITRKGGIPLVRVCSLVGEPQVEVAECTPTTRYTAIPHVWINGLGNPKKNVLPQFQLGRLASHLSASAGFGRKKDWARQFGKMGYPFSTKSKAPIPFSSWT